jgi:triosephosphate isomerase
MRSKLIVGNWKMNGSRESTDRLLLHIAATARAPACVVVVCPPFPMLSSCADVLKGSAIAVGAQDVSDQRSGAYTGEVSADMLRETGCGFVLVGHSERRVRHRESDEVIARKAQRAVEAGITPIVCVGETLAERNAGATEPVLVRQVQAVMDGLEPWQRQAIAIAYEPVWAIGTGATATPSMVQEAHAVIRRTVAASCPDGAHCVKILYGGSVKPAAVAGLVAMPDIDGCLVGGASLDPHDFSDIVRAAGAGLFQGAATAP